MAKLNTLIARRAYWQAMRKTLMPMPTGNILDLFPGIDLLQITREENAVFVAFATRQINQCSKEIKDITTTRGGDDT